MSSTYLKYIELFLSQYMNLGPSLFLLSYMFGSHTSMSNDSTGEVLNAPAYILLPSLFMLSSFLSLPLETIQLATIIHLRSTYSTEQSF